jgi:chemotaxis protein CheD
MLPRFAKYHDFSPVEAMYVDTGISALVRVMAGLGSNPRMCEFKVFGGAQIMRSCEYFRIGEQNIAAMQALTTEHRLQVRAWEVGGHLNRSITLHLETGLVGLRMPNRPEAMV